ncbi:MAG: RluA family pseudouridine synthase [Deltaproteobacteria bacterium]|nr:RluA family pseudouridine synthase [Deltaproteobacteria bacterium]MBW2068129.1 RluA family pseudouridine synthase [Deltaproteobacteria bacterium]
MKSARKPASSFQLTYWQWKVDLPLEQRLPLSAFIQRETGLSSRDADELIRFGSVHVNSRRVLNPKATVTCGDEVRLYWPWHGTKRFYEISPDRILYEDQWFIFYNKEPGIPCQQTPSDSYNNVYEALKRFLSKRENNPVYLAIHHRLDQDTSGIILFVKDKAVNKAISFLFKERKITKEYLVCVEGEPPSKEWVVDQDIIRQHHRYGWTHKGRGKSATTFFKVLQNIGNRYLLLAIPRTGRTHQIRLHVQASGLKIPGDRIYGGPPNPVLLLHSWRLTFRHPVTEKEIRLRADILPDGWPHCLNMSEFA